MNLYKLLLLYARGQLINILYSVNISIVGQTMVAEQRSGLGS